MKSIIFFSILSCLIMLSCKSEKSNIDNEKLKQEIFAAEKKFEATAREQGIAIAFYQFADSGAVILRGNDSLILGNKSILNYYNETVKPDAEVSWTPDFIEVSDDGTLGYTYGKYLWKIPGEDGNISEYRGVFHTVWKRQADGSWKYVWD